MRDPIARIAVHVAAVTPKTHWIFFRMETADGLIGVGEASLNGREPLVLQAATAHAAWLFDLPHAVPSPMPAPADLPDAAALSAIDQALWDIAARRGEQSVATALGGQRRAHVPLYANINRRTVDRHPDSFAASARAALAVGFDAVKIAPFDEVTPGMPGSVETIGPGLDRIAATRAAIGAGRDLLVDCHWRFDEHTAATVIQDAAAHGVHWIECPLPETAANLPALRRLRSMANARGIRLAGCELGVGMDGFIPFLRAGTYDVMMPDAKYVGGLAEMLRLADSFAQADVGFSPHNPTGPVCHAASLQVCAAATGMDRLEVQFDETPLFDELVADAVPRPNGGTSALPGLQAGLGVTLVPDVLQRLEVAHVIRHRNGTWDSAAPPASKTC